MKKIIFLFSFILVIFKIGLFGYNKSIPLDYGFYGIATGNSFQYGAISMESVIYNPAMLDLEKSKFQLDYVHKEKNPFLDTAGFIGLGSGFNDVGYTIYLLNSKFNDSKDGLYKVFNLGFALSKKISGIITGVGIKYYKINYNSDVSKTENLQYNIGIKKTGKFSLNKLSVGLSFNSAVNFNWDNDFVYVKQIPAQIIFNLGLNRDDFYMFFRLNYILPVTENINSNYSFVKEDDELRLSVGFMYDIYLLNLFDVKFLTGYQYIDTSTQILGYGISVSFIKSFSLNFGGETGRLVNNNGDYDKFVGGISFNW